MNINKKRLDYFNFFHQIGSNLCPFSPSFFGMPPCQHTVAASSPKDAATLPAQHVDVCIYLTESVPAQLAPNIVLSCFLFTFRMVLWGQKRKASESKFQGEKKVKHVNGLHAHSHRPHQDILLIWIHADLSKSFVPPCLISGTLTGVLHITH